MSSLDFESGVSLFYNFLWGNFLIYAILFTGIAYSFGTRFIHLRYIGKAFSLMITRNRNGLGDISPFEAFMTSLAATIGTGNISGVSLAIMSGGPGAVFWMWMTGLIGGAVKYGETLLAIRYRIKNGNGEMSGGPMYYISAGMEELYGYDWKWLGWIYAAIGVIASFGLGNMVQANSVSQSIKDFLGFSPIITGFLITVSAAMAVLGGIKTIGKISSAMVPFMCFIYVTGSLVILANHLTELPHAFGLIISYAFNPSAVTGGTLGAMIKHGISRGLFSNEAGLGSSSIVQAAARTDSAVEQGLIAAQAALIDTFILTLTALVILSSGILEFTPDGVMQPMSGMSAVSLATMAYDHAFPFILGPVSVSFGMITFAFSTLLGWYYYGSKCLEYIAGERAYKLYTIVYITVVFIGSSASNQLVWSISDVLNGLLVIPNLFALIVLFPLVTSITRDYENETKR